jgi:hypothetical protein
VNLLTERYQRERQQAAAQSVLRDCGFRCAEDVRAAMTPRPSVRRLFRACGFRSAAQVRGALARIGWIPA